MKKRFIVLVADLVESKKIKQRAAFQKRLVRIFDRTEDIFGKDFYAPVRITRGDEMAAVLNKVENLYQIINHLTNEVYPNRIRFVFVRGTLNAGLETKDAGIIDGPAFSLANEQLIRAKKKNLNSVFMLGDPVIDEALNSLANLVEWLKQDWTKSQRKIYNLYQKLKNQKEVAKKLKVSQQNVAKTLKSIGWGNIMMAEKSINNLLENYNQI